MIVFKGIVQKGDARGRELGFPTANVPLAQEIEEGIYVSLVKVVIPGLTRNPDKLDPRPSSGMKEEWYSSVTFIGSAKTFGKTDYKAEVYILDFSEDLYGKELEVQLLEKLRDNKKFDSVEELVAQMKEDELAAREYFKDQNDLTLTLS